MQELIQVLSETTFEPEAQVMHSLSSDLYSKSFMRALHVSEFLHFFY